MKSVGGRVKSYPKKLFFDGNRFSTNKHFSQKGSAFCGKTQILQTQKILAQKQMILGVDQILGGVSAENYQVLNFCRKKYQNFLQEENQPIFLSDRAGSAQVLAKSTVPTDFNTTVGTQLWKNQVLRAAPRAGNCI